jgi:hypothetical protein
VPLKDKDAHKAYCRKKYLENREELIRKSVESLRKRMENPVYANARKERVNKRHHERKGDKVYQDRRKKHSIKTRLKSQYGLTELEYWDIHKKQNGKCGICGRSPMCGVSNSIRNLVIDHCHNTNKIRGLLCTQCNVMLGMAGEKPEIFTKAIEYLAAG